MLRSLLRPAYKKLRREYRNAKTKSLRSLCSHEPEDRFATHLPYLLALCQDISPKSFLELGGGTFSTPALYDKALFPSLQRILTVEDDADWASRIRDVVGLSEDHVTLVDDVSNFVLDYDGQDFDIVFIDDSKTIIERAKTVEACVKKFPNSLLVIHDFEVRAYQIALGDAVEKTVGDAWRPWVGMASFSSEKIEAAKRASKKIKTNRFVSPSDSQRWSGILTQE